MILDKWVADAERLAASLPKETAVASRVDYLLHAVAPRAVEVSPAFFSQSGHTRVQLPDGTFWAVDKSSLSTSPTALGRLVQRLPGHAFVVHSKGSIPSVMALADHSPSTSLGNSHMLLHELEHITEYEAGLVVFDLAEPHATTLQGKRERRAYQLGSSILTGIDGSDFERYIEQWPVTVVVSDGTETGVPDVQIDFHDERCPVPPNETLAYAMWEEGVTSQRMLQSIGRMSVLEKVAVDLPDNVTDFLAGKGSAGLG